MVKRIVALLLAATLISAGLLYFGIKLMTNYGPALASSVDALVARGPMEEASDRTAAETGKEKGATEQSAAPAPEGVTTTGSEQRLKVTVNSAAGETPPPVTVAEVVRNADQYEDQVFTLSGIATALGDGKFLLNDGTGQILIEVDDDAMASVDVDGQQITVTGELDDDFELETCTLTYRNGTVIVDDCQEGAREWDDDVDDDDMYDDDADDDLYNDSDDDDLDDDADADDVYDDDYDDDLYDDDGDDDLYDDGDDDDLYDDD